MNICEKKNQIQDLLNDIYSEYNRMNESKIQNKCETDLEMRTMINNIRSLETNSLEKDSRIKSLEKTIFDYEKIIENLSEKLELKEEYDRENNRHDMLRTLSKDISEKDREIDRLNGLLKFHKKEKNPKNIDNLMGNINKKDTNNIILNELSLEDNSNIQLVECEPSPGGSIHSNDEVLHLEPEPSNPPTPTPIPSTETIKNNSEETTETTETNNTNETNETNNTTDNNETNETNNTNENNDTNDNTENNDSNEIDNLVDEENISKTLMRVKYKGQYYFVYKEDDPDQGVYEYNEEKQADKIIGKRIRINGKWSWKLF